LQLGLARREDDPVQALSYLIGAVADLCRSTTEDGRRCEWNSDPTMFEAFRLALALLLERLRHLDTSYGCSKLRSFSSLSAAIASIGEILTYKCNATDAIKHVRAKAAANLIMV
jgi:hypothetical protein